jgi:hypothetical protein
MIWCTKACRGPCFTLLRHCRRRLRLFSICVRAWVEKRSLVATYILSSTSSCSTTQCHIEMSYDTALDTSSCPAHSFMGIRIVRCLLKRPCGEMGWKCVGCLASTTFGGGMLPDVSSYLRGARRANLTTSNWYQRRIHESLSCCFRAMPSFRELPLLTFNVVFWIALAAS